MNWRSAPKCALTTLAQEAWVGVKHSSTLLRRVQARILGCLVGDRLSTMAWTGALSGRVARIDLSAVNVLVSPLRRWLMPHRVWEPTGWHPGVGGGVGAPGGGRDAVRGGPCWAQSVPAVGRRPKGAERVEGEDPVGEVGGDVLDPVQLGVGVGGVSRCGCAGR